MFAGFFVRDPFGKLVNIFEHLRLGVERPEAVPRAGSIDEAFQ